MGCLYDYTQDIKHSYFIKTGEVLRTAVTEAVAQAGGNSVQFEHTESSLYHTLQ